MQYGIVTDSGCDFNFSDLTIPEHIHFARVPLTLDIGEETFLDNETLDIDHFMNKMQEFTGRTGSAAPSPADFYKEYEKSDIVFVITITSQLSATYQSALLAADMFQESFPDRKIFVIDSKSAGPEMFLIAHKLVELITRDLSFEKIKEEIQAYQKHTNLLFVLQSMENLIKNGRVSRIKGMVAGIFGIKVIGLASPKGTLELVHKCRGTSKLLVKLIEELKKCNFNGSRIYISHCFATDLMTPLTTLIKEHYPQCEIRIVKTGGLCSYYAEPGGIMIGFES